MKNLKFLIALFPWSLLLTAGAGLLPDVPSGQPQAVIDLASADGLQAVQGEWRYSDTRIVEIGFQAAGPEGQPTGHPVRTYDYTPHAGAADYDDSGWEVIGPGQLQQRRSTGKLCFNWYRIGVTLPERINGFAVQGATVVFDTSVDDYAEVWVDGELPRAAGQNGGSVVAGWNTSNRLAITRNAQPGKKIQIAVFGINGPLSSPPTNFIWMRHARLEFYPGDGPGPWAVEPHEVNLEVVRLDPEIDRIVPPNPKLHKLAEGFQFTEGPVWDPSSSSLLFSDPNANRIYRYAPGSGLSVFLDKSGYDGADIAEYGQPGSNGITLDAQGRPTFAQHGNHSIARREPDGAISRLVEANQGQRLNSPNDLVFRSDGLLYFTDPPFGLPRFFDDPRKELPYSGVYSYSPVTHTLRLESKELSGPNGLAFSPDEKYLYVGNWDEKRKVVMRYAVAEDGSLSAGEVFFDMTQAPGEDAIDGLKVDREGHIYVSGPGGLWILSPQGKHLGTVLLPRHPHNFAWGDEDDRTLYLCSRDRLYRMRLEIPGVRPD